MNTVLRETCNDYALSPASQLPTDNRIVVKNVPLQLCFGLALDLPNEAFTLTQKDMHCVASPSEAVEATQMKRESSATNDTKRLKNSGPLQVPTGEKVKVKNKANGRL